MCIRDSIQAAHTGSTYRQHIQAAHIGSTYRQHIQAAHTDSTYRQHIQIAHRGSTYMYMYSQYVEAACTYRASNYSVYICQPWPRWHPGSSMVKSRSFNIYTCDQKKKVYTLKNPLQPFNMHACRRARGWISYIQ